MYSGCVLSKCTQIWIVIMQVCFQAWVFFLVLFLRKSNFDYISHQLKNQALYQYNFFLCLQVFFSFPLVINESNKGSRVISHFYIQQNFILDWTNTNTCIHEFLLQRMYLDSAVISHLHLTCVWEKCHMNSFKIPSDFSSLVRIDWNFQIFFSQWSS